MNATERAAKVIGETIAFRTDHDGWAHHGIVTTPTRIATDLADAGLLLTDADRAVIAVAKAWVAADMGDDSTYLQRCQATYDLRHTVRKASL